VLEVDVERVEARGSRDARDLDARNDAHGHRRHQLAAGELVLHAVAQHVAGLQRHAAS